MIPVHSVAQQIMASPIVTSEKATQLTAVSLWLLFSASGWEELFYVQARARCKTDANRR